ncbi:MAG: hypothetical protein JST30_06550 [Armatimonadetes bacterium]|nr:hypothetical protein [Armatimonadota bacterium]
MHTGVLLALAVRIWSSATLFTTISDRVVDESSGVGVSTRHQGVYYTHNDSGDTARFFRFKEDGSSSAVDVLGAGATDWEDMACLKVGGKSMLYFGDIGDNAVSRANVTVYRFQEPDLVATSVLNYDKLTIKYPDGAHNCEALFVDPGTGDIYLVTKASSEAVVYRLPAPPSTGTYTMTKLGTVHPDTGLGSAGRLVTAGDASPDGRFVILRTYTGALEYPVKGAFQDWWKQSPENVKMPLHAQGESIAYGQSGRFLFTTSEGSPCPVHRQKLIESVP